MWRKLKETEDGIAKQKEEDKLVKKRQKEEENARLRKQIEENQHTLEAFRGENDLKFDQLRQMETLNRKVDKQLNRLGLGESYLDESIQYSENREVVKEKPKIKSFVASDNSSDVSEVHDEIMKQRKTLKSGIQNKPSDRVKKKKLFYGPILRSSMNM